MKSFMNENWYKMMVGTSLLVASFSLLIFSVSKLNATDPAISKSSRFIQVPLNADGSINVKLSDAQLDKIIPKNEEGRINVKMAARETMDINLAEIDGRGVAWVKTPSGSASLCITPPRGHGSGDGWGWIR